MLELLPQLLLLQSSPAPQAANLLTPTIERSISPAKPQATAAVPLSAPEVLNAPAPSEPASHQPQSTSAIEAPTTEVPEQAASSSEAAKSVAPSRPSSQPQPASSSTQSETAPTTSPSTTLVEPETNLDTAVPSAVTPDPAKTQTQTSIDSGARRSQSDEISQQRSPAATEAKPGKQQGQQRTVADTPAEIGSKTKSPAKKTPEGTAARFSVPVEPTTAPRYDLAYFNRLPKALVGLNNNNLSLIFPLLAPAPITSPFGWRIHPISGDQRFHSGTDLGAPMGTPVVAAYSGFVETADVQGGYGLAVTIIHNRGIQRTLYGHLSELLVKPGQWVEQGSVIGLVGSTGNSTGPHLHFELWQMTSAGWTVVDAGPQLEYALARLTGAPTIQTVAQLSSDLLRETFYTNLSQLELNPHRPTERMLSSGEIESQQVAESELNQEPVASIESTETSLSGPADFYTNLSQLYFSVEWMEQESVLGEVVSLGQTDPWLEGELTLKPNPELDTLLSQAGLAPAPRVVQPTQIAAKPQN